MNIDPMRPGAAVGYVRTATSDPTNSSDEQTTAIKAFCVKHGIPYICTVVDIGVSGLKIKRNGLDWILSVWVDDPEVRYFITKDRNRISRRAVDFLYVEKEIMEHDKELVYLEDEQD